MMTSIPKKWLSAVLEKRVSEPSRIGLPPRPAATPEELLDLIADQKDQIADMREELEMVGEQVKALIGVYNNIKQTGETA